MTTSAGRQRLSVEDLARTLEDIQQRADEAYGDLSHLVTNFHIPPGPLAQALFAQRSLKRGAQSLEIGARLALEVK